MEEQVVEEVVEEQVAEAPDTSEIEAAYLRERDAYVAVRDAYITLTQEGAEAGPKVSAALEAMLSKREKYAAAYTVLMLAGVTPEPPPPDPRFVMRDRSTKEVEEENEHA